MEFNFKTDKLSFYKGFLIYRDFVLDRFNFHSVYLYIEFLGGNMGEISINSKLKQLKFNFS